MGDWAKTAKDVWGPIGLRDILREEPQRSVRIGLNRLLGILLSVFSPWAKFKIDFLISN